MKPLRVVIGLGTNLGARLGALHLAGRLLCAERQVTVKAWSGVYESPPFGPPQPDYLNAAVLVETTLTPRQLLGVAQAIEQQLGRQRAETWGPRTLDLDLLWCDTPVTTSDLQIPHPELERRWWALRPLLDVAPFLEERYQGAIAQLPGQRAPVAGLSFDRLTAPGDVPAPHPGNAWTLPLPAADGARLDQLVRGALALRDASFGPSAAAAPIGEPPRRQAWPDWQAWASELLLAPAAGRVLIGAQARQRPAEAAGPGGIIGACAWAHLPSPGGRWHLRCDDAGAYLRFADD